MLQLPFLTELEKSKSILIAGAGGGFDIFSGLPLYFALRQAGRRVHLANLSFSYLGGATGKNLTPFCLEVTADSQASGYFPEFYLSCWFREQGEEVPIYTFERSAIVKPLVESYRVLADHLGLDTVILIDGGTDSLMRGDEAGLGTPEEDIASIAAVDELDVANKYLVCLGFGVDSFHGVCHTHVFEAIADLTKQGAFLGCFSMLREMPEVQRYLEACEAVRQKMPTQPSIVCASIISALEGHYGNHHRTERTEGSTLWINPLMTLYWCFKLEEVSRRIKYLDAAKLTYDCWELMAVIDAFREQCGKIRERAVILDNSIERRKSR